MKDNTTKGAFQDNGGDVAVMERKVASSVEKSVEKMELPTRPLPSRDFGPVSSNTVIALLLLNLTLLYWIVIFKNRLKDAREKTQDIRYKIFTNLFIQ